jgi:flagellar FliL protein
MSIAPTPISNKRRRAFDMAKNLDTNNSKNNTNAASDSAAGKNPRKKILIITALIIALVVISVGSTLALVKVFGNEPTEGAADDAADTAGAVSAAKKPAIYYPLQPVFVVNFESQGRQRFLQAELSLMLRDDGIIPVLELHMPAIRNSLVMLFSGQTYEDLQTVEGKELLRQQALLYVQEVLEKEIGKPGVEQVLFTNFVMQ